MKTLNFTSEGPLQAWGVPSLGVFSPTAPGPTHNGVVGLICCCLGIPREDPRIEELSSILKIRYDVNEINGKKKAGTVMIDYQTTSKEDGEKLNAASGGLSGLETVIRRKAYLEDASFTIHVTGPDDIMDDIYNAMNNPVWVPYLGRKCCTPSIPIIPQWE